MIDNIKYKSNKPPPLRNLRIKNKKGFTLIEIIIVIIVLGILSIFGFSFISTAVNTYSMMEKQKGLFDQATMVMERISRELRDANTITVPNDGVSDSTILTFTKSHVTEDIDTTISFNLSGTTLQRLGTATVNLADNVSTFTAGRVISGAASEKEEITITLTLESGEANITLRSYICPKNLDFSNPAAPSGRNFGGSWEEDIE